MIKVTKYSFLKYFKNSNLSKKYCQNSVNRLNQAKKHFWHFYNILAKDYIL